MVPEDYVQVRERNYHSKPHKKTAYRLERTANTFVIDMFLCVLVFRFISDKMYYLENLESPLYPEMADKYVSHRMEIIYFPHMSMYLFERCFTPYL